MSKLGRITFVLGAGIMIAHAVYVETSRQEGYTVLPLTLRSSQPAEQPVEQLPVQPVPVVAEEAQAPASSQMPAAISAADQQNPVVSDDSSNGINPNGGNPVATEHSARVLDLLGLWTGRQGLSLRPLECVGKAPAIVKTKEPDVLPLKKKVLTMTVAHPQPEPVKGRNLISSTAPATVRQLPPPAVPPPGVKPDLPVPAVPTVEASKPVPAEPYFADEKVSWVSNYTKRLAHVNEQLDLGIERHWVSAAAAQRLKAKYEQLTQVEKSRRSKGYTRGGCDAMERDITQFSYWVTEAINGREISLSEGENAL